ncbi:MAG TPA: hypothetical protein VHN77_04930 [Phycisphaerales bacterium]|nr:hypothetical protein [Phycisphaerales bacterium]
MSQAYTNDSEQSHEFKDGVEKVGERMGAVKHSITNLAHDAVSTARVGASEVATDIKQGLQAGRKSAARALDGLSECAADNPLTTMGIALGVGVVIGYLVRGSRS